MEELNTINYASESIELLPGIFAVKTALFLKKYKMLAVADLHIGYEAYLNQQGIFVPRSQFQETKKIIEYLIKKLNPNIIVINGDLKHEFSGISKQEWYEISMILDILLENTDVVLVKGNHDTILEPIARKKGLCIKNFFVVNNICFLHGHKIEQDFLQVSKKIDIIIIAHDHPAVTISDRIRTETYKCFLLGKWHHKKLIVMPSMLPIVEGHDVLKEKMLSPFLQQKLNSFEIFVVADKIYKFGKIKNFIDN